MSGQVNISGSIDVGGGCGGCGGDGSAKVQSIALGCGAGYFGAVVSVDAPVAVNSPNTFVDLPLLGQLTAIYLFFMKSNAALIVRVGAVVAKLFGISGLSTFAGGETLLFSATPFPTLTTTFVIGDQTMAAVAARINAAAMIAGWNYMPATVDSVTGKLVLSTRDTGPENRVLVSSGTGVAKLGFTAPNDSAYGAGSDIQVNGMVLVEFDKSNAPARIQVKGSASELTLLAAGPST